MKLKIVPASQGASWVRSGIRTFFKQPLALSGLFLTFMAALTLAGLVPFVGSALALALLPAATLGFMAATREAVRGKFPMPTVLISAFRAGRKQMRAMWILGALYAAGFLCIMGISALFDGGELARLMLAGGEMSNELIRQPDFQMAALVVASLSMPLSLLFWHAPALVHWHEVPPLKSLFFSIVACLRNWAAFAVYGLAWCGVVILTGAAVSLIGAAFGGPALAAQLMSPAVLLLSAMFMTSVYFSYLDSFEAAHEMHLTDPAPPPS